jgi:large subunit ribosomal protein L9
MKVILTDDLKSLGKRGAVVSVTDGYARNFLFPKKLAVVASDAALKNEQEKMKLAKIRDAKLLAGAKEEGAKFEGKSVTVKSKAGTEGKLYGKITAKEIAAAIKEQLNYEVDRRKIHIDDEIKALGQYPVSFKLHPEVTATINVKVEQEV